MRNTGFGRMVASFRFLHFLSVTGFVLAGALALLFSAGSVALAAECPNPESRTGASAGLPDCRAYELVSPADTGDQAVANTGQSFVTSEGLLTWGSASPIAPASNGGGDEFLAQRAASGWQNTVIEPPVSSGDETFLQDAVTPDGSNMVVAGELTGSTAAARGQETSLLLRAADGSFTTVVPGSTQTSSGLIYVGGSSDLDTVVFNTSAQLVAGTETDAQREADQQQLYSWAGGTTSVVGLDSAGQPFTCGATIGNFAGATGPNAVSADGSTVFMQSSGDSCPATTGPGEVYARIDGQRTVELSAPDLGVADPNGIQPASFLGATPDGSTAYFLTSQPLTRNDTNEEPDIYKWQTTDGGQTSTLTCVTCGTEANADADVQGGAVVSPDGSHVWFVAEGRIDGQGVADEPNLYVYNGKSVSLVTTQGPGGGLDGEAGGETTPDGTHLLFEDLNNLTTFNSHLHQELYLADDAASGPITLACVSCAPSGAAPTTDTTRLGGELTQMSADGSEVFFVSENPLLPAAANANGDVNDVYEWNDGVLSLISSGTSQFSDTLLGTDASGDDVFFASAAQLVPQVVQDEQAIYDARVGGGFPAGATQATTCSSADTCRSTGAVPAVPVAGTVGFVGPGDRTAAMSTAKTTAAKVRVTRRAVRGSALRLTVEVPARGTLTIAGADVKRLTKSVGKAGSYGLTVHLTARAAKRLRQKRKLRVAVKVAYRPDSGKSSSASVSVTVKA